jgi:hypothetical protein
MFLFLELEIIFLAFINLFKSTKKINKRNLLISSHHS